MAPRALKAKLEDDGAPEILKPKTEKAKVEKSKAEPKTPKVKAEKALKVEKAPKAEKVEKISKLKAEKKVVDRGGDGKVVKEKVKAVSGDEAVSLIVEYLKAQNRPFSATEVSANLHGKVTKTVADKLLKELGEGKTIGMHSTNSDKKGSQFVFWTLQDPADAASPEELAAMDLTISTLKTSLPPLKSTLKIAATKLATLKSAPTTSELQTIVHDLRASNAEKAKKLNGLKAGEVKQVSKEDMARVEKEHKYWAMKRKVRKQAYEVLEDMLLGSGEKTREELREELGVDDD